MIADHDVGRRTTGRGRWRPRALNRRLRPSNTRSSLPPTWFTNTIGTRCFRAMLPSISSRSRCLPTEKGDAERLTIALPRRHQRLDGVVVVAAAFPEVAVVPDVLADADAEPAPAELEQLRAVVRLEVAVLVEDVVGGEQLLAKALADATLVQQHRRVEERPSLVGWIGLRQSDKHRWLARQLARELGRCFPALRDEGAAQQQVAGQIAHERELGCHGKAGAAAPGFARSLRNQRGIAREIADQADRFGAARFSRRLRAVSLQPNMRDPGPRESPPCAGLSSLRPTGSATA